MTPDGEEERKVTKKERKVNFKRTLTNSIIHISNIHYSSSCLSFVMKEGKMCPSATMYATKKKEL